MDNVDKSVNNSFFVVFPCEYRGVRDEHYLTFGQVLTISKGNIF